MRLRFGYKPAVQQRKVGKPYFSRSSCMCVHTAVVCTHSCRSRSRHAGCCISRVLLLYVCFSCDPTNRMQHIRYPPCVPQFWWLDYHFSVQKVLRGYLGALDCKRLIQLYKNCSHIKKRCSSGHNLVEGGNFIQVFHEAIFFFKYERSIALDALPCCWASRG